MHHLNMEPCDVYITNHGSVCLVHPLTDAAREWLRQQNVMIDNHRFITVEPKELPALVEGVKLRGLSIEMEVT